MNPRLLIALNVNDRDLLSADAYPGFLEVQNAQSAVAVQGVLRSMRSRSADLFLVDVDMQHASVPNGLEWGDTQLRAYGPLLALPFLDAAGVSAFVPYSNFWGYPSVTNNGFVLVSVSLLLSQMYGRPFSLSDVKQHIEASVTGKSSLVNEADTALRRCLELYRSRLEDDGRVQLVDIEPVIERLEDMENTANATSGWPLQLPLADAEGLLAVELYYPPHFNTGIQLASLFGDLLQFRAPQNTTDLLPIYEVLERWKERSATRWGDTLYASVVQALQACGSCTPLDKAAVATPFVKRGGSKYQLIRMGMEFAWVRAWKEEPDPRQRIAKVHALVGLEKAGAGIDKNAATLYKRFLGVSSSRGVQVSDEPWRTPFWTSFPGVSDAYKLNRNEPSTLTPFERSLCIKYAIEDLGWDAQGNPGEHSYPVWMT